MQKGVPGAVIPKVLGFTPDAPPAAVPASMTTPFVAHIVTCLGVT
jgi:hypothetical protein